MDPSELDNLCRLVTALDLNQDTPEEAEYCRWFQKKLDHIEHMAHVAIYRALLDKQRELLEPPTCQVNFQRYLRLVDVYSTLKDMHLDNWIQVNSQDLLNKLLAPLDVQMKDDIRLSCCPVSMNQ